MVKANVNGACYPESENNCIPHKETGICTYGWSIILSKNTQIIYNGNTETPSSNTPLMLIVYVDGDGSNIKLRKTPGRKVYICASTYNYNGNTEQCFVITGTETTKPVNDANYYDLTLSTPTSTQDLPWYDFWTERSPIPSITENTIVLNWIYDTLYAFPIKMSGIGVNSPDTSGRKTDIALINTIVSTAGGVGMLCNSFFSKHGENLDKCQDPLSKTGSQFIGLCVDTENVCVDGTCIVDVSKKSATEGNGYTCMCKGGYTFNGRNCQGCSKTGDKVYFDNSANHQNINGSWTRSPGDLSNGDKYKEDKCCSNVAEILQWSGGMAKCVNA